MPLPVTLRYQTLVRYEYQGKYGWKTTGSLVHSQTKITFFSQEINQLKVQIMDILPQRDQLERAIAALEAQRAILGNDVVDTAVAGLRQQQTQFAPHAAAPQRKQVTVLFGDLVGFTAMSNQMDAEEVGDIVNLIWAKIDQALLTWGGAIDKHVGDGVIALFGVPMAQEDDALRAVQAGLAMQSALSSCSEELARRYGSAAPRLQMRVGIHTGLVLFGKVGITGEMTVMGDTVNLASRLEGAAAPGRVLISQETWNQVTGSVDVEPVQHIQVKGVAEPLSVYTVTQVRSGISRSNGRGVVGVTTRTVGREKELAQMQSLLQTVEEDGSARVLTLVGEAGVGKSRLLQEFCQWMDGLSDPPFILTGRAHVGLEQRPYWLMRDCIAQAFRIHDSDPGQVARHKLSQGFVKLAGIQGEEPAAFVGHLIGFDFAQTPQLSGILDDAQQIQGRAYQFIARFFRHVTQNRPGVILLEDIHWADEGTLDLVDYLTRECRDSRLLIVCLARPTLYERLPRWGKSETGHLRLDLPSLSPDDSRELVREILRFLPDPPTQLVQLVVDGADGNAFYMEELIKVLIEDGVLVPGPESWRIQLDRLTGVRAPKTLTAVLQARLDRLSPDEREILQRAAIMGRVFWEKSLYVLHPTDSVLGEGDRLDAARIRRGLAKLEARDFVISHPSSTFTGEREYAFRHAMLHEVTYESVLLRNRRIYHAQAATWLVQRGGERVAEYANRIGEHWEKAQRLDEAAGWFFQAGEQARAAYAPELAIAYYEKALSFKGEAAQWTQESHLSLYDHFGEMLLWQAHYEEAETVYRYMAELAAGWENWQSQSRALNQLSEVQGRRGNHPEAIILAEQAAEIGRSAGLSPPLIQSLLNRSNTLLDLGNPEGALLLAQQSLDASEASGAKRQTAQSLNLLGICYDMVGESAGESVAPPAPSAATDAGAWRIIKRPPGNSIPTRRLFASPKGTYLQNPVRFNSQFL